MDQDEFRDLASFLADKQNGFVTFSMSQQTLESLIYDVSMMELDKPPPNKLRKIIFKDACTLNSKEKLQIVGQMVGKQRLSETEIYDAMIMLHDDGEKLTINKIAEALGVSSRTIHRNMSTELKKEKELLNSEL
jgi:predicted nuclease of restriction endonuclease-like RecB superfamily